MAEQITQSHRCKSSEESACLPCRSIVSSKKTCANREFHQPHHPLSTPLDIDLEPRQEPSGIRTIKARAVRTPTEQDPETEMPAAYAVRDGGDAKSKKQSMADLKLRRLQELNSRLKEDLDRPRIRVSEASAR